MLTVYFCLLFVVFPLYFKDKYWELAFAKWKFYLFTTLPVLVILLLTLLPKWVKQRKEIKMLPTDWFVAAFGVVSVISWLTSYSPQAAFMGAFGWYMGVVAQILFVASYFLFSYCEISLPTLLWCNCAGTAIASFIAVAQRCGWDFLHLFWNLTPEVLRDYISPVGNRTWFSAYLSVAATVGIYLWWRAMAENKDRKKQWALGIYSFVVFMGMLVSYSDSVFAALAVIFSALGVLSLGKSDRLIAYAEVICLWFASCTTFSLLHLLNRSPLNYASDIRGFAKWFVNPGRMAVALMICVAATTVLIWQNKKKKQVQYDAQKWKKIRTAVVIASFAGAVLLLLIIVLNTMGVLEKWFGITIQNSYLYFDEAWGDFRGKIWMFTMVVWKKLPFLHKFFGVGPDCYALYVYNQPEYLEFLKASWGDTVLGNAHNEWLNMLFCRGVVGVVTYLGSFVCAIVCFLRAGDEEVSPMVSAVGLGLLAYCVHNIFCYQQASATAPAFVPMGIAAAFLRKTKQDH